MSNSRVLGPPALRPTSSSPPNFNKPYANQITAIILAKQPKNPFIFLGYDVSTHVE
jgi:hypothetical protein